MSQIKKNTFFAASDTQDVFFQITIPPGAFELETPNEQYKGIIIEEGHYAEGNQEFILKPRISTPGSILEISNQGPLFSFIHDDSIRKLLGCDSVVVYEKNILSLNPVDIISFDKSLPETDIAHGMFLQGRRTGMFHNFLMDVDPGYKFIENFRGVHWFLMESKDFLSNISFELKI